MGIPSGQPKIRFNKAGPFSLEGITYPPKTLTLKKTCSTATENEDFWVAPAGTFITRVCAMCLSGSGNTTTRLNLGTTGATQALFNFTNFSMQTTGNFYMGSTALYLPTASTIRLSVIDTPAASTAYIAIEYYESADMFGSGVHFDT